MRTVIRRVLLAVVAVVGIGAFVSEVWPEPTADMLMAGVSAAAGLRSDTVVTEAGPVGYMSGGAGETVVFLHGIFAMKEHWIDMSRALSGDYRVVLLDLPGFGSNLDTKWRDYTPEGRARLIIGVADELNVSCFVVLGHSMGGVIASLFAGTFADKVQSLTLLDSLGPMTSQAADTPKQLAKAILDVQRTSSPLRVFSEITEALQARKKSSPEMSDEALLPIVERNLKQSQQGFSWRTDARLRHASKVRLTEEQVMAFLGAIDVPVLVIMAEQGIVPKAWVEQRMEGLKKAQLVYVPGHHHFHAEWSGAEAICRHIINAE